MIEKHLTTSVCVDEYDSDGVAWIRAKCLEAQLRRRGGHDVLPLASRMRALAVTVRSRIRQLTTSDEEAARALQAWDELETG